LTSSASFFSFAITIFVSATLILVCSSTGPFSTKSSYNLATSIPASASTLRPLSKRNFASPTFYFLSL